MKKFDSYQLLRIVFAASLVLFAFSFIKRDYSSKVSSEASQVERSLQRRQKVASSYVKIALADEMDPALMENLPEDIVIYRYFDDTLQYWFNRFPVGNDNLEAYPFSYRLESGSSRNASAAPLAYLNSAEQYLNLGSGWYVVSDDVSEDRHIRVISGILVRTEYPSERITGRSNPKLSIDENFTTAAISDGCGVVVRGVTGEPLFSVVPEDTGPIRNGNLNLRWLALILLVAVAVPIHYREKSWKSFAFVLSVLTFARLISYLIGREGQMSGELFSPILYADSMMFGSLGSLLISSVLLSLAAFSIFVMREKITALSLEHKPRRIITVALAISTILFTVYIIFAIRSLALNSNIALAFFRIADFSIYSLFCYLAMSALMLALLCLLQMLRPYVLPKMDINLFSWRCVLAYAVIVALYCTIANSVYYVKKETDVNRVITNKLAIDRDVPLELYLRQVEPFIANDRFIALLTSVNGVGLVRSRLVDMYFNSDVVRNYNIDISVCNSQSYISMGETVEPVGCYSFYEDMIADYGIALDPASNIFYLENFNGLTSYLGVFTYIDSKDYTSSRLFIKIESKSVNEAVRNPIDYLISSTPGQKVIPPPYSYARYSNGRLVMHGGNYDYPVTPPDTFQADTYSTVFKKGYVHFVNRISEGDTTIVSRRRTPFMRYVVSFSYLLIIFGLIFLAFTRRGRSEKMLNLPRRSMRRKYTVLIMASMLAGLLCSGIGSVLHVININGRSERRSMEEKIEIAQKALSPYCQYAIRYKDLDSPELYGAMVSLSKVQGLVNIFDTRGNLVRSTKPEIYEQSLSGRKINDKAYSAIIREGAMRFLTVEKIADISFHSLYAPLFNNDGTLVAIVNVPYFERSGELGRENLSSISAVINVYLVLLIAVIFISIILSNSFSRPLDEIKRRLEEVASDDSQEDRHIIYKDRTDELGMLVESYNKMVDDLKESKKRLAVSEREQAWKEMAKQIAHDIKNPLTPMRLSIQHLMRMKESGAPGWEDKLEAISKALLEQIDTLSESAGAFYSYSSFFSEDISVVNLDELIREHAVLYDNRDDIALEYIQLANNPVIEVRRKTLSKVLVNLLDNAVEALDESATANSRIKIMLTEEEIEGKPGYRITVEDNGPGVPDGNIEKLFVPNFTTKSGGTGLGLAISSNIMTQSGGSISYERSELLGGACFTLRLPARQ